MSRDTEVLLDRLLARLEDARGFKAWWNKLDEQAQDDTLLDLGAIIKNWAKE